MEVKVVCVTPADRSSLRQTDQSHTRFSRVGFPRITEGGLSARGGVYGDSSRVQYVVEVVVEVGWGSKHGVRSRVEDLLFICGICFGFHLCAEGIGAG